MRLFTMIFLAVIVFASCADTEEKKAEIATVNFEQLSPRLHENNDTLYIVNFWASWCNPCVKEIPDFEKINAEYKNRKVKMIMVSLDFPNQLDTKVIPFIAEQKMTAEVVLLFDPNANSWINEVSPDWTGSIPATLIYKKDYRNFREGSYSYNELKQIVELNL